MAEFDYEGKPKSSFPFDPTQERGCGWSNVMFYWNPMLKGESIEPDNWKFLLSR
jgi:sulfide:quinone oxidoreductase